MQFTGLIFNEIKNVNRMIDDVENNGNSDAATNMHIDFESIRDRVGKHEIMDYTDFSKHVRRLAEENNESIKDAKIDLLADRLPQVWADGSLQLNFVPANSLLSAGLRRYFAYLDKKRNARFNWPRDIENYVRSGVFVSADNPFNEAGFFFATGLGYDTSDELFSGLSDYFDIRSEAKTGTGVQSGDFIDFLNTNK